MAEPSLCILYVDDHARSTAFYADLLGRPPVEHSPAFALFALGHGAMLGLWARPAVAPAATRTGGGTELAFPVSTDAEVDAACDDWSARGLPLLQAPTRMEFGYTFVAADPDGHRLRVFAPAP